VFLRLIPTDLRRVSAVRASPRLSRDVGALKMRKVIWWSAGRRRFPVPLGALKGGLLQRSKGVGPRKVPLRILEDKGAFDYEV
jgi:hypothetical protein